jgi:soluble lytic murein transglycosylase-like protein
VHDLRRTDAGLRRTIDAWSAADPGLARGRAPENVQLWALRQQRVLLLLRDRPATARAVLRRLPGALRRATARTLSAMTDLRRLAPRDPPKHRTLRVGPPLPAGRLLALYHQAGARFHVAWHILAAVNFVETGFNKLRNNSVAGAQGPMQFMPATWRAYGLGGDIHDPPDAIVGAANFLRASGAPASYRRALYAYNPSSLYVDAVLAYARRMARSRRAFLSYYSWQVFVRTSSGRLRRLTGPGLRASTR